VRGRLQRDDFIEDDDGGGYADNGMDAYGEEDGHYIGEEDSDCEKRSVSNHSISV
jgi:DNA polymerase alpha subunit A